MDMYIRQTTIATVTVHYNYNVLCGGEHEICNTAHSFDLRCESVYKLCFSSSSSAAVS